MKKLYSRIEEYKEQGRKEIAINAINCTVEEIHELKQLIKAGKLTPSIEQVKQAIKEEYVDEYLNGNSIAPQMVYQIH